MRRRDLVLIGIWTIGTAGLLTIVQPQPLTAGPEEARKIEDQPRLTIDGCEIEFRSERPSADALPVLYASLKNPGNQPAHPQWSLRMMVTPPSSPMARTIAVPKESWREDEGTELDPYQSSSLRFEPKATVQKGASAYFVVTAGKQTVTVMPAGAGREELAWVSGSPGKRQ